MNNRRVNDLGGGKLKIEKVNEAALETANARIELIGSFRVDSLAASQAGVAEKYQGVDANAAIGVVAPRAGHIVGMTWNLSTVVTAGTCTASPTVNTTADAQSANLASALSGQTQFATPIPFAAGDRLGVKHTTNGGFTPTPHVAVDLLVRWTALEPATPEVL